MPARQYGEQIVCPKCHATGQDIKKVREEYYYPGGDNPIRCTCSNCGHVWYEMD